MEEDSSSARPPDLYGTHASSGNPEQEQEKNTEPSATSTSVLVEDPPTPSPIPVEPIPVKKLSWRQRRKIKRRQRTMQDKATRTTWRAFIIMLLPLIGVAITYYFYTADEPKMKILISAGATAAAILLLAPLVLWGAISSIRRGTRRMLLSLIMGFYSGVMTVLLVAALTGAVIGYGIVTGEPIPIIDQNVELPGNLR